MSVSLLTTSFYAYAGDHAQQLLLHNLFLCQVTYTSVLMHDLCPCTTHTASWGRALGNTLAASCGQCSFHITPCENFRPNLGVQEEGSKRAPREKYPERSLSMKQNLKNEHKQIPPRSHPASMYIFWFCLPSSE